MATPIKTLAAVAAGTVLATGALAQSAKIEHHIAKIGGTGFHYVTAGTGDPVLLIPGWPESWIACRKVGWGFAQFTDGKPEDEAVHKTCFSCHEPAKDRDFVFTRYAP